MVANVGDSRAVLSRDGQPMALSAEHRCATGRQLTASPPSAGSGMLSGEPALQPAEVLPMPSPAARRCATLPPELGSRRHRQYSGRRLSGSTPIEAAEIERVQAAGGWVADERVCDILMVSRAFGDADFKGRGLYDLVRKGVECALACTVVRLLGSPARVA